MAYLICLKYFFQKATEFGGHIFIYLSSPEQHHPINWCLPCFPQVLIEELLDEDSIVHKPLLEGGVKQLPVDLQEGRFCCFCYEIQ